MVKKLCGLAELVHMTQVLLGPELDLGEDKYAAIEIGTKVHYNSQNKQEKFVDEFLSDFV